MRYRVCEGILGIINSDVNFIETLSEDTIEDLRTCILERVNVSTCKVKPEKDDL